MRNRISKESIFLVLLLLVFVIGGFFFSNPDNNDRTVGDEISADPSIYNDRSSGSQGLFNWTSRLGYAAKVEKVGWSNLPSNSTLLISAAPEPVEGYDVLSDSSTNDNSGLSTDDAHGIVRWLSVGRTLLLMTSRLPVNTLFLGHRSTGGGDKQTFGDIVGLTVQASQTGTQTEFVPMQPSPLVAGVDCIELSDGGSRIARLRRNGVDLFAFVKPIGERAQVEASVMEIPVGKGRIICVSDDHFASNVNLAKADNAAFIANVIDTSARPGSNVLFDEYHHGDEDGSPSVWLAMGPALHAALWQCLLVFILIVAMVAPRFGTIKAYKRGEARESGEYLTSLAGLYLRAEATVPALETLYRQFLRDLCERLALPPDIPLERLAAIAARQGGLNPNSLKRLFAACETALDKRQLSPHDLFAITKQMEQVKRQLK